MSESPEAFTTKTRKARKVHKCCECYQLISIGEEYQASSGIWDGEPASYKQCLGCRSIMTAVYAKIQYDDDAPGFGEMKDYFNNYVDSNYSGEAFVAGESEVYGVDPDKLRRLVYTGIEK
jgi:hypothetical protein